MSLSCRQVGEQVWVLIRVLYVCVRKSMCKILENKPKGDLLEDKYLKDCYRYRVWYGIRLCDISVRAPISPASHVSNTRDNQHTI